MPREIRNLLFRETGLHTENPNKFNTCLVGVEGALKCSIAQATRPALARLMPSGFARTGGPFNHMLLLKGISSVTLPGAD